VTARLDETHDPDARSWVASANDPATDFPIQNLPLGMFHTEDDLQARPGIAIGDQILDLKRCDAEGWLQGTPIPSWALDFFAEEGREPLQEMRAGVFDFLREGSRAIRMDPQLGRKVLVPASAAHLHEPMSVINYTDFYASVHHATNVGSMLRPDNPLLPNYKWVPIGYHGRASSIVLSGTPIVRPKGQTRDDANAPPAYGPSRRLDYELEVGVFIAQGNALGETFPLADAERRLFGICLVNDWSARDLQTWEYQPLGPFLAKSFATSISPWVVTFDALEPFRVPRFTRAPDDPQPLPYLDDETDRARGGIDITLEVLLSTARMRTQQLPPHRVSLGSFRHMYWTLAQMVTHHASNGCNLQPGDLIASGTVSGPEKEARGCLLERTWRGTEPIELPSGETRRFLEDGDEVIMRGWCEREGYRRIGLGECRGVVLGAR